MAYFPPGTPMLPGGVGVVGPSGAPGPVGPSGSAGPAGSGLISAIGASGIIVATSGDTLIVENDFIAGSGMSIMPSGSALIFSVTGGGGGGGVPSVNGITAAVTVSGLGSIVVTTVGDTIIVSGSTASGGGGSPSWYAYPIDVPPASPSIYDDEFTAGSLNGKWSVVNATTGDTLRSASVDGTGVGPGYAIFDSPYTTGDRIFGIVQAAASGVNFTITAKLQNDNLVANYGGPMLWLKGTNGKWLGWGTIPGGAGAANPMDRIYLNSDYSYNTDSAYGNAVGYGSALYARVVYDGTYYNLYASSTGFFGGSASSSLIYQEPASNWIGAISQFGIGMHPYGIKTRVLCDWFRCTTP